MKRLLIPLLVIIGLLFVALAVYYWITPADSLPSGFPGHMTGSSQHHLKHGLAALLLGLGCWVLAWFSSGNSPTSSQNTDSA